MIASSEQGRRADASVPSPPRRRRPDIPSRYCLYCLSPGVEDRGKVCVCLRCDATSRAFERRIYWNRVWWLRAIEWIVTGAAGLMVTALFAAYLAFDMGKGMASPGAGKAGYAISGAVVFVAAVHWTVTKLTHHRAAFRASLAWTAMSLISGPVFIIGTAEYAPNLSLILCAVWPVAIAASVLSGPVFKYWKRSFLARHLGEDAEVAGTDVPTTDET